jgi:hypothetical protein
MKHLNEDADFRVNSWNHLTWIYDKASGVLKGLINSTLAYEISIAIKPDSHGLSIGSEDFTGEITEFQLWKHKLSAEDIK